MSNLDEFTGKPAEVIGFLTDPAGPWHDRLVNGVSGRMLKSAAGKAFAQLGRLTYEVEQFRNSNDGEGGSTRHPAFDKLAAVTQVSVIHDVSLDSLARLSAALTIADPVRWPLRAQPPHQVVLQAVPVVRISEPVVPADPVEKRLPPVRRFAASARGVKPKPQAEPRRTGNVFEDIRNIVIRSTKPDAAFSPQRLYDGYPELWEDLQSRFQEIKDFANRNSPTLKLLKEEKGEFRKVLDMEVKPSGIPVTNAVLQRIENRWKFVKRAQSKGTLQVPTLGPSERKAERDPLYVTVDKFLGRLQRDVPESRVKQASGELSNIARAGINIRIARGSIPPHITMLLDQSMTAVVEAVNSGTEFPKLPVELRQGAALKAVTEPEMEKMGNVVRLRENTNMRIALEQAMEKATAAKKGPK